MAEVEGDDTKHAKLRDRLVTEHLPLAQHIAQRFSQRGEMREDLTQVAILGLINAVDRFDPHRGVDFLAFAVPTIMGEVRRHFRDSCWAVRVPRRLKELHLAITAVTTPLAQELGRAATPSEIAARLEISKEEVYEGLAAGASYQSVSLNQMLGTEVDSVSVVDSLGEEDPGLEDINDHESLQPLLRDLPERERTIIMLRFFGNLTQTEIADRVGISQMHVSRLLAKTLRQLREGMLGNS
jgi:RNA polymerase sigma-B factor